MEANKEKREQYLEVIKDIDKSLLVYIDESGIDMTICKDRGWGQTNKPLVDTKSGKYFERTNIIAGFNDNKSISPIVFSGTCNTNVFNTWVEQFLIKELQPGQFVIMDNASFHKSLKTVELIESVGCKVIYLPPYSQDFNPIEKFWANMKRWIKQRIADFDQLFDALVIFFQVPTSS